LLVIESATPVNWMEPKDIDFTPGPNGFAPAGKVGTHFPGGFNALFCDGSVRFLPLTITAQDFLGAITMAGGEVIKLP
jgi:prepilin-type processing-associated H-X9-DG protein